MATLVRGVAAIVRRQSTPEPERPRPTDPVAWIRDELGEHCWSKMREVARSVMENRETLVPSCHGPGKTWLASRLAAYWIAAHEPGEARIVSSAPSDRQVRALLWNEIGRAKRRGNLPGTVSGTSWWIGPPGARELVGEGAKPADLLDQEQAMQRFQGTHARHLLVIVDEATGIPPWLWTAIDSLLTGSGGRLLAIGNPDDPSSEFANRCDALGGSTQHGGAAYTTHLGARVIPIDAYATPAMTGEPIPTYLRDVIVDRAWIEDKEARWGRENPLYQSKVRARFPDRSTHNVIGPALIRRAIVNDLPGTDPGCYGLDVARSAHGDESCLARDRGGVIRTILAFREPDTEKTADIVEDATRQRPATPIAVDVDGIGGGVFDKLRRRGRRVVPFSVNMAPRNPRDFDTRRSEVWWSAREEMEDGLWDLDEADQHLLAQLQAPRWSVDGRGRIHVETKAEMAKRGVSSPDRADAAIMARFGRPTRISLQSNGASNGDAPKRPRSYTADLLRRPL